MKSTILLRFDPEVKEVLKEISKAERRSLTSFILKIIDDYLKSYTSEVSNAK